MGLVTERVFSSVAGPTALGESMVEQFLTRLNGGVGWLVGFDHQRVFEGLSRALLLARGYLDW